MTFAFYSSFCKCATRGRKIRRKKTKKLSQFLKSHISGTREAISLKFGKWSAEVGGHVHSKNRLVSSRKHRATKVRKLRFLSSCQYTHRCRCYARASWAARHTTVCLDFTWFSLFHSFKNIISYYRQTVFFVSHLVGKKKTKIQSVFTKLVTYMNVTVL